MSECALCGKAIYQGSNHHCPVKIAAGEDKPKVVAAHDPVNAPSHYTVGGIQTIDYMEAKLTSEQFDGYLLGNVIKYTSRFQHKNGLQDLQKAQFYLDRLVKRHEKQTGES